MFKRFTSLLLALTLLVTAIPFAALAEDAQPPVEAVVEAPVEAVAEPPVDNPAQPGEEAPVPQAELPVEKTPEELFAEAAALLPQTAAEIESVTPELLAALEDINNQMKALLTEEQLAALSAKLSGDETADVTAIPEALQSPALLVLSLNARVDELNLAAATAAQALVDALPAADVMTVADEALVNEASAAVEALLDVQKALVSEQSLAALDAAKALMAELIAKAKAAAVDELIDALPDANDINLENFETVKEPLSLATAALSELNEYELGFVSGAATLDEVEASLQSAEAVAEVVTLLQGLPTTESDAHTDLTFTESSDKSVAKALLAEEKYNALSDTEKQDTTLAPRWQAFNTDVLPIAKELDYIQKYSSISINYPNIVTTVNDSSPFNLEVSWVGLDNYDENDSLYLISKYPLTVALADPADTHIRLEDQSSYTTVIALEATDTDSIINVYGSIAHALKELAAEVTVTVLAEPDPDSLDTKAWLDDGSKTFTFNRAYKSFYVYDTSFDVTTNFSIGGQSVTDFYTYCSDLNSIGVSFSNQKIPTYLSVDLSIDHDAQSVHTYINLDNDAGSIKNGTYTTKLIYHVPLNDGSFIDVTTDDMKIVVKDSISKISVKSVTLNTWDYSAAGYAESGPEPGNSYTSPYKPVVVSATGFTSDYQGSVVFTNNDPESPFVLLERNYNEFVLCLKDTSTLFPKTTTKKLSFHVSGDNIRADREYDIKFSVTAKSVVPKTFFLENKSCTIEGNYDGIYNGFYYSLQKGWRYDISSSGVDEIVLAPQDSTYQYQDCYTLYVNKSVSYRWELGLSRVADDVTLPKKFKLKFLVTFIDSDAELPLEMTVNYKPIQLKIKLLNSSVVLNVGDNPRTYVYYQQTNGYLDIASTSITNASKKNVAAPDALQIDDEFYMDRLYITPGTGFISGDTYKVALTFTNGQKFTITVNTKPTANTLTVSPKSFSVDASNKSDILRFKTFKPKYVKDYTNTDLVLEWKNGKVWEPADNLFDIVWNEHVYATLTPKYNALTQSKYTLRVYAPQQGIPAAKAVTLTVNLISKLKFTATQSKYSSDVLRTSWCHYFYNYKLTGYADSMWERNLLTTYDNQHNEIPSKWYFTVGGEGAKYLKVLNDDESDRDLSIWSYIDIGWKQVGSSAMKQNGLKSFKYTIELRERATNKLIVASSPYTFTPTQKTFQSYYKNNYEKMKTPLVTLHNNMPYQTGSFNMYVNSDYAGESVSVTSVTVKDAAKSNYRAWLLYSDATYHQATIGIGYKNAAAATKCKGTQTVTLLVTIQNGVKPIEVKVQVKNVK